MKSQIASFAFVLKRTWSTDQRTKICLRLGAVALGLFLLGGGKLFSQADTGSITGTATDTSGAVIPGVRVTIADIATNQQRTLTTDGAGRYSSGPLRPGEYRIEAEKAGFRHLVTKNVVLQIQETALMDLRMEVGATQEQVTVTTAPPLIETADASQGSVIEETRVANLPLNGRDYLQLSLLSAGAQPAPGLGDSTTGNNNSRAGGFSASGQRTTENNYLVDGFDNNVVDVAFDYNQGEIVKPSVDAIQEFKVQTNSYPAQFGRAAGGVVNLTLKSGSNSLHGTAYDFVRNQILDARNLFDFRSLGPKPSFKRNDFGFSVGGPFIRNKAFFFFAWEDELVRNSALANSTLPTAAEKGGDFSAYPYTIYDPLTYNPATGLRQPFPGNKIPSNRIDPVAAQIVKLYPAPQNNNITNNYVYIAPNNLDLSRINTREDYQLSQKDQLAVIFNSEISSIPSAPSLPAPAYGGGSRTQDAWGYGSGLTWNHVFTSNLVTSTKAGWFGEEYVLGFPASAVALGNLASQLGLQEPANDLPVKYPNFGVSGWAGLGPGNFVPYWSQGEIRQILNDTVWTKGAHTIQFGGSTEWIQSNSKNAQNEGGTINFSGKYTLQNPTKTGNANGLADLLLGDIDNLTYSSTTRVQGRTTLYSAYAQDTWKANNRLTLSYGLRYGYMTPYRDIFDRMANLDMDTNPAQPQIVFESQAGANFMRLSKLEFDPRVGLTYQLLKDKLIVRTGYGIYTPFQRFTPYGTSYSLVANSPYNVTVSPSSNGITPWGQLQNGIPTNLVSLQAATAITLNSEQINQPHANSQQWDLNVQYQFAPNWMLQVGYFGSKGTHLFNAFDANYVPVLGPGSVNSLRRLQSLFIPYTAPTLTPVQGVTVTPLSKILRTEFTANANFNSMQTLVTHQFANGFTLLANWMWSKGLGDTYDGNPAGTLSTNFQQPGNLKAEYGPLGTNIPQIFVVSGVWDLPYGHGKRFGATIPAWANSVLGGWSLNGIVTWLSGGPFTATTSGNPSNSGQTDRPNISGNPYSASGGKSIRQYNNGQLYFQYLNPNITTGPIQPNPKYTYGNEQRNGLLGPRYSDIDGSLSKTSTLFSVKDQPVNLQFRWDVFNIVNHPNLGGPNGSVGSTTFGQITSALQNQREMQIAAKLIW